MIENNYFSDNPDLLNFFNYAINWSEIVDAYELDFKDHKAYKEKGNDNLAYAPSSTAEAIESYRMILESAGDLMGTYVAPRAAQMDNEGLKFSDGKVTFPQAMIDSFAKTREAGIQAYAINRKYGGLGMPATVQCFLMEVMGRADGSFAIAMGCINLAETIERFGDKEMIEEWVPKMAIGEVTGAMALTEPDYGSDLPNIQTRAAKDENGNWYLTGTKRFITHACGLGDTPAVILTLARTGSSSSGAKGLSFFLVKSQDVEIAGVEKKLGLHTSPTCEVVYDNSPGKLIGKEGMGLIRYAMGMMNAARLSIAGQSMGIASAAHAEAVKYANERKQFGKFIKEIPAVSKMLARMDREIAAMRCLLIESARSIDRYYWMMTDMEHSGVPDREIRKNARIKTWEKLANFLTPLGKYYNSELCNSIAFDAIQIHGGAGYTEEYDAARIYRDARITNIYEGTTQLQMHAAIGGATAGMSPTGHIRAYIDEELTTFSASTELLEIRDLFETIVDAYKAIEDSNTREKLAFETVEAAARFINGLLMERATNRMEGAEADRFKKMSTEYHIDSKALLTGNLIKIQSISKVSVSV